jgi:glucosylceramidase
MENRPPVLKARCVPQLCRVGKPVKPARYRRTAGHRLLALPATRRAGPTLARILSLATLRRAVVPLAAAALIAFAAPAALAGTRPAGPLRHAAAGHGPALDKPKPAKTAAAINAGVVQTTADLSNALTVKSDRAFQKRAAPGSVVTTVNANVRYQHITGFGAAMTDSSAWLLQDELTPAARQATMTALFSPQGIHLNSVRIPMGASDFTVTGVPYTYDDMPAGQTDPTMANFSVAHDEAYIVPALQEMLAVNPGIVTLANPWTAPAWMKANQADDNMKLAGVVAPADYPALAQYFVKFIQAYQAHGVPIDDITMMNEPHTLSPWPGTAFMVADQIPFLGQNLAPALAAAGLKPKIYGLDDTELADAQVMLQSPVAGDITGSAFHCYQGMGSMNALHAQFPAKDIIVNECSPGIIPYSTGEVAIDATRNWASSVQLWNLALDPDGGPVQPPNYGCGGCTGIVTVNEQTHTTSYGLNYYQLGQVSKYVQPGAVRINSNRAVSDYAGPTGYGVTPGLDNVAFVNPDGSKVLVATNNSPAAIKLSVDWHRQYLNWTLASRAMVTFTWR